MKALALLTKACVVLHTAILLVHGADSTVPANKPPGAIVITNRTDGSAKARTPFLSAGLPELMKMHQAGVDAPVLLAFIQSSPIAYHPSAKEIIYLRDLGISSELIAALLRRGGELRDRAAEAQREERNRAVPAPQQAPAAAPAPASPPPQASAPTPTVVYANASYPVYTYPTYATYPAYGYAAPFYYNYNYSYCRPYSYYRPNYYSSAYVGYRSGCYPRYGLSVGFSGGRYAGYGGGYRHGGWSTCRR